MTSRRPIAILLGLSLVVAGCGGSMFTKQPDNELVLGQTTRQEILQRLGTPYREGTVSRNGKTIDAVAQATKHGFLFVFDRVTGEPLFPIEERPVPKSDVPGEEAWPTQPFPTAPPPFARQIMTETDITPSSTTAHRRLVRLSQFRNRSAAASAVSPGCCASSSVIAWA